MAAAEYYNSTPIPVNSGHNNFNTSQPPNMSSQPSFAYHPPPPNQHSQPPPLHHSHSSPPPSYNGMPDSKPSVHFAATPSPLQQQQQRQQQRQQSYSSYQPSPPNPQVPAPGYSPNQYPQPPQGHYPAQLYPPPPQQQQYLTPYYQPPGSQYDHTVQNGYISDPEQHRRRKKHKDHARRTSDSSRSTNADGFLGAAGGGLIGDMIFPGLGTIGGAVIGWVGGKDYGKHRKEREEKLDRQQRQWEKDHGYDTGHRRHSHDRKKNHD